MLALDQGECQQRGRENPANAGMRLIWRPGSAFQGLPAKFVILAVCDNPLR
jgi:hypothetical protein